MSHQLQFSVEDCKSPERLERLFRQLNLVIQQVSKPADFQPDLNALSMALAPLISKQLEAPGIAPLNLQSLLPDTGQGLAIEDTHANRLTNYLPANYDVGTLFWETDRTVLYVITQSAGTNAWTYAGGNYRATFANRPTDLGTNDAGFQFFVSVYIHLCIWSGSGWGIADGGGGYIVDAVALPAGVAGWQLCDGTATTYLTLSGVDLAETAFTTPDENSAPSGVYHKSIAAYSGTINAATGPALSGNVANATATNQATTATNQATTATNQNTVVTAHAVVDDLAAGVGNANFATPGDAAHATHTHTQDSHNHTQDSHNHTQDAHTHAITGVTAGTTGEPRNMGVLKYFRR